MSDEHVTFVDSKWELWAALLALLPVLFGVVHSAMLYNRAKTNLAVSRTDVVE